MDGWLSGWLGEWVSIGVDVLLLMYRAEGRSSRNSFLQWVQNQIVKRVMHTSELLEDEKHRQRDGTRRVLSCCLCCESESIRFWVA